MNNIVFNDSDFIKIVNEEADKILGSCIGDFNISDYDSDVHLMWLEEYNEKLTQAVLAKIINIMKERERKRIKVNVRMVVNI